MKHALLLAALALGGCSLSYQPACKTDCDAGTLSIPATGGTELSIRRDGLDPQSVLP